MTKWNTQQSNFLQFEAINETYLNQDKTMKQMQPINLPIMAVCGLALALTPLHAQTAWDGGGGDSDYSNNLNWAGDIIPGNGNASGALIGNSSTQTVIYNTATGYTSSGTAVANSLRVGTGTNGAGSLTLSGDAGTLTFGGDGYNAAAWIGSTIGNTNATGAVTVSAGKLAIGTGAGSDASINLGVHISGTTGGVKNGTLTINGGTVEVGRRILMGANATTAVADLTISSGTLDMKRTGLSGEGDLGMIRLSIGNNTVNLDGGTVIFSGFHTNTSGASSARSIIFMNGTTLKANATIADLFNGNTTHTSLRLKDGGLVLDTNGFNVTINDALTQETGHTAILRKEGTGTLTITGAQATRTGTTTVNGGTLRVQGNGTLGTGATTVSGSGSILDLARNDTWGNHSTSVQALGIQSGGLVTNGTAVNSGFTTIQTLALDGGELRVTGTARALDDGDLKKFEAYSIRNSVTVSGTAASSITNPGAIANAGINIGGYTNLGGGVGADLTFNVADVTNSSAADLAVSAVLKNNYDAIAFNPLSNGLVKTGDGTMSLSAVNRYTGATTVAAGVLAIGSAGSIASSSTITVGSGASLDVSAVSGGWTLGATQALKGTGTVAGNATIQGTHNPGDSPGIQTFSADLTYSGSSPVVNWELFSNTAANLPNPNAIFDQIVVAGDLDFANPTTLNLVFNGAGSAVDWANTFWDIGQSWVLFEVAGTTSNFGNLGLGVIDWLDGGAGAFSAARPDAGFSLSQSGNDVVLNYAAIPEPGAALLGGLGLLALLLRRRC
jgi:autotransporter-associated beta strand protein